MISHRFCGHCKSSRIMKIDETEKYSVFICRDCRKKTAIELEILINPWKPSPLE